MKDKKVKLWKKDGKFYVFDGNKTSEFTQLSDALRLIFLLKEIRAHFTFTRVSLYPVDTLDPRTAVKQVTWNVC